MNSRVPLAPRAYPDRGTGTSEYVFSLLDIRGSTNGEGMQGIEPGSPVRYTAAGATFIIIFKVNIETKYILDDAVGVPKLFILAIA